MSFAATLPETEVLQSAPDTLLVSLRITESLHWFSGHFPSRPIVPGVVQIGWVVHFAAALGLTTERSFEVSRAKFSAVIEPGMTVRLSLKLRERRVDFRMESASGVHSSGTLCYG